jgi:hypothetical protein
MDMTRAERRQLFRENQKWPVVLRKIPRKDWPDAVPPTCLEVWRSRDFLLQVHHDGDMVRLTVCRSTMNGASWVDGISWDELQQLKRECGRGMCDALEVYPSDPDVVNVANMRHLWIPSAPVPWAWRKQ